MNEGDPLLPLAESLYVGYVEYVTNETPTRREVHTVRWAYLSALKDAERQGWRFNYVGE